MPRSRRRSVLLQLGSVVLGVGLLYLALRPVSFDEVLEALEGANFWFLVPMGVIALASHLLRAWRWLLLLETLPQPEEPPRNELKLSFYSVMIGYMVNYAAPRLGEIARAGNYASQTKRSFSSVFGTVVSERVLDVLTLGAGFILALVIAAQHMAGLGELFAEATGPIDVTLGAVLLITAVVALGGLAMLWIIRRVRRSAEADERRGRVAEMVHSFTEGLLSLKRAPRRLAVISSTVAIWLCYAVMTYLPLPLLGITGLGAADVWLLLIVGSIGMTVPAPGGIGSYHFVTIHTMTRVLGVGVGAATTYAVIVHASQLVLYVVTGFVCLVLQGRGLAVRTSYADEGDDRAVMNV